MRNRIKVEYQSENGPITIYYSVIGSSVEESIESITPHVNEYAVRTNTSIISMSGID
jgi:hypothetical protein